MRINYPLLIDGGLSNQLESQGCNLNHKLWSAKMVAESPEEIVEAHLTYLKAGAHCITTSSYQATVPGFIASGFDDKTSGSLIVKSVQLAEEAIEHYSSLAKNNLRPLIAASIGPYGAYLADGSEYHGNYDVTDKELKEFHQGRISLLDKTNADFFACETIPSFQEARILAELLKETNKSAWVSFSCKDEQHINDGTPIEECVEFLANHSNVFALGVNCTAPKYISGLIKSIKKKSADKKIVVYPNSGEVFNADNKTWFGLSDPNSFVSMAKEWHSLGADILGGCCRIGPEHISSLHNMLLKG